MDMEQAMLTQRTFFILQTNLESAASLQDRIVRDGGRALTADSLPRALMIAKDEALDEALIEYEFAGAGDVVDVLRERGVRYMYCSAASLRGLSATAGELPSTKSCGAL